VELVETHISWVFLTGTYAYKVKKPVNFGFLDFTSLPKRLHFCQEELRLNSRLAESLYLDVVPITGTAEAPEMEGSGTPLEFAVKMSQFDQKQLLSRQLQEGRLVPGQVDDLADWAARFHAGAVCSGPQDLHGTPEVTHQPARDNFQALEAMLQDPWRRKRLEILRLWTEREYLALTALMISRKEQGFVRECHGDLHLGNVTQIGERVVAFDGIEFNDSFRWIDVMSEIAFLFTDLEHRGRRDLAWRALSRYLEGTGDFTGVRLLRYYNLHRIMVRTKVDALRLDQPGVDPAERISLESELDRYFDQAEATIGPRTTALILTRGLSGSGKTFLSQQLLQAMGAVRARSDVERKRLFGLEPAAPSGSGLGKGLYSKEATARTFGRLLQVAGTILEAGYPVIVDATFLDLETIKPFRKLALGRGCPFRVLDLRCPTDLLRSRLSARAQNVGEASEAGQEVLTAQLMSYRPLDDPYSIPLDSGSAWDAADLVQQLQLKA
jgi:aminoglycoside phosphotransferase family enzyme/predicted kinase